SSRSPGGPTVLIHPCVTNEPKVRPSWSRDGTSGCASGHHPGTPKRARNRPSAPEDRPELVGHARLELVVATRFGRLVRAPALECRRVPEPVALEVVVGD